MAQTGSPRFPNGSKKTPVPSFIQSPRSGFSFSTNLKQHRSRERHQHDRHDDHPPDRRDKFVSAIGTNSYVQAQVLLAGWTRLHYRQCILSVSWLSIRDALPSSPYQRSLWVTSVRLRFLVLNRRQIAAQVLDALPHA